MRAYGPDGASLGSGLRVHVAAFAEPPRMVIFGAIDFASALAPLAKGLGYRVTIADPRRAFLESPRFSSVAQTVGGVAARRARRACRRRAARRRARLHARPEARRAGACGPRSAPAPGYIGALGSRRTTDDRNARLREAGVTDEQLARVYAPCGLDIGSSTVEETAVAILGEIIASRTARAGRAAARRRRGRSGATASRRRPCRSYRRKLGSTTSA